jgi:hypothetical protein
MRKLPANKRSTGAKLEHAVPEGPKGQKCPADVIGNAVKVMRIDGKLASWSSSAAPIRKKPLQISTETLPALAAASR